MPIGGNEDHRRTRAILSKFVALSRGEEARIAVIPTASQLADTGSLYCRLFKDLGAAEVRCIAPETRQKSNHPELLAQLEGMTGIFLTGGDQSKLISMIGATLMHRAILARFTAGAIIGGTSAGASALSEHMIAFGRSGSVPCQRMVNLGAGLGLAPDLVIDQHFRQRDRLGRLVTAVLMCPGLLGVGIDEDTALIIHPDQPWEVFGTGTVTIVDGSQLEYTDMHEVKRHLPISVCGMQVHTLAVGDQFDFSARQPAYKTTPVAV